MPQKFNRLIEPFAGMAAITIAVSKQNRANGYLMNDINEPLVCILKEAVNEPENLVYEYSKIWNEQFHFSGGSIEHYYKIRDEFNNGNKSAANMLYLLARCVKGSVRYGSNGMFNQSPDKRRNGTSPDTLSKNVRIISNYLKGKSRFTSIDYQEVLKNACAGDIVYMDPPYQGVCGRKDSRYFSGIDFADFIKNVEFLNEKGIDFIISYDGQCGDKQYGEDLPKSLELSKVLLNAGLSSQSLLLGKKEITYEALYLSKNLKNKICPLKGQYELFSN